MMFTYTTVAMFSVIYSKTSSPNSDITMKLRVLLLLLTHLALTVSGQTKQSCLVQGYIKEIGNRPICFIYQQDKKKHTDTVFAVNGYFTYEARPSIDSIITFSIGTRLPLYFWYEPGIIRINGEFDIPRAISIEGTPENEILNQFRQQIDLIYPTRIDVSPVIVLNPERERAIASFIKTHPNYRTSASLLSMLLIFNPDQFDRYKVLYEGLGKEIQTSRQGKELLSLLSKF